VPLPSPFTVQSDGVGECSIVSDAPAKTSGAVIEPPVASIVSVSLATWTLPKLESGCVVVVPSTVTASDVPSLASVTS
jgi:hypothetical protein